MTVEILTSVGHIKFLFLLAVKNYGIFILVSFIIIFIAIFILNKKITSVYTNINDKTKISIKTFTITLILYILIAFLCIRGSLNPYDRPIRSLDASLFSNKCGGGMQVIRKILL